MSKPYRLIPIQDCGEPLVPIPVDVFPRVEPHPYQTLGAPYGAKSPFFVRQGVRDRLLLAQTYLDQQQPGWKILIFDAFRPLAVQQFMVDYTLAEMAHQRGWVPTHLSESQRQELYAQVSEFWALPDADPTRPPPHSTGGAIDITLLDAAGRAVDMGSAIDEMSPRSYPNYYDAGKSLAEQQFCAHRELLKQVMGQAGFKQHPNEWWHFCYGDQLWAWLVALERPNPNPIAIYGSSEA